MRFCCCYSIYYVVKLLSWLFFPKHLIIAKGSVIIVSEILSPDLSCKKTGKRRKIQAVVSERSDSGAIDARACGEVFRRSIFATGQKANSEGTFIRKQPESNRELFEHANEDITDFKLLFPFYRRH